jgi:hypothetical protein
MDQLEKQFIESIDAVVYINLKHREDRDAHMKNVTQIFGNKVKNYTYLAYITPLKTDFLTQKYMDDTRRMDMNCIAFTAKGTRCSHRGYLCGGGQGICLCGKHENVYFKLKDGHYPTLEEARQVIQRDIENFTANRLQRQQRIERRRLYEEALQQWIIDEQMRRLNDEIVEDAIARRLEELMMEPPRPIPPPKPKKDNELEKFVKDKQNVHTSAAVNQTKQIIETILKIDVPASYKWNMKRCSKTPGEIISECRLSIDSSRTMMDKYTMDDNIYELGNGIYGRVLDCVWQYIKKSEDKKTLCKILKTELEDNIGMCQQGNLSRLANVLAGYLEGIGSCESLAEILGREFPKLWDIEDEDERVAAGNAILDRLVVKDEKVRNDWIGSLY